MSDEMKIKNSVIKLQKCDITDIEIEAFVFYARYDLVLGAGFGTAISTRGGPKIQEELKQKGKLKITEAIISGAGMLKADKIIHSFGPRFQEPDLEGKLRTTIVNCLKQAEINDIKKIAFSPMGTGFYGIPLDMCSRVMFESVIDYLDGDSKIEEVVFCLMDNREYLSFHERLFSILKTV